MTQNTTLEMEARTSSRVHRLTSIRFVVLSEPIVEVTEQQVGSLEMLLTFRHSLLITLTSHLLRVQRDSVHFGIT